MNIRFAVNFINIGFFIPILVLVQKFYNYKICLMRTDRLGHLALNTQLFFVRNKEGLNKDLNYFLIAPSINSSNIANKDLLSLYIEYSKNLHNVRIICSDSLYFFFDYSRTLFSSKIFFSTLKATTSGNEFLLSEQMVSFTEKQKNIGDDILIKMGINKNNKLVSIYTRDSGFLENQDNQIDWSYHDYRDTNIESYLKAIKYLIKEGYTVIRIGSEYSKSLGYINDKYIEYNLSNYKSKFMDLYFPYISSFMIGCKSGATDVSVVFNTPILNTDLTIFSEFALGKNDLFIQKKLLHEKGHIIPFKDLISDKKYYLYDGNKMNSLYGISYLDNSEHEILEATKEMHKKIMGNFELSTAQNFLLKRYHKEYCKKNKLSQMPAPISISWLEKNNHLYL
jgi:putative glycosyltransferase (TIGR04372 family)